MHIAKRVLREAMPHNWLWRAMMLLSAPCVGCLSAWGMALLPSIQTIASPILLIRTLGVLLGLIVWLLAYIAWLLYKRINQDDKQHNLSALRQQITIETLDILKYIAYIEQPFNQQSILTKEFACFGLSEQELKYHIELLHSAEYVQLNSSKELIGLTAPGRKFLKNKNMLPTKETS